MNKSKPINFYKCYLFILLVLRPILTIISIINTSMDLSRYSYLLDDTLELSFQFAIFLLVIDFVLSIVVGINLKNLTPKGYGLTCCYLIFRLITFSYIQGISQWKISFFFLALIIYSLCFTLPVWIYFKKRKYLFFDEPESEPEQPENDLNEPINAQNQTVSAIDPIYVVPAQPERPTTQNQIQATIDQQESATIQTKQPVSKPSPATNKRYCRYCGKELLENTSFCRHCGQKSN